jgi:lantibiotic modifying enzyme
MTCSIQVASSNDDVRIWSPVLTNHLQHDAEQALLDIAQSIPQPGTTNACLAGGDAGFALFHAYFAKSTSITHADPTRHEELMFAHLQAALDALPTLAGQPDLIGGFTGIAWTINHLQSIGSLDDADEICDGIDETLIECIREQSHTMLCELLTGLSGLGLYSLTRQHRRSGCELLKLTVNALKHNAIEHSGTRTWFNGPEQLSIYALRSTPQGCFNLGLSHGVPGAIAFLSQAASLVPAARDLASDAVKWLLLQARRYHNGSRYTYSFLSDPFEDPNGSRVAWCYGDLGIAVSLLRSARFSGRPDWEHTALALARNAANRPVESANVRDAALCHGAFGNAHIFRRLYAATHEDVFLDATLRWVEVGLSMRRPGEELAGYQAWNPARDDDPPRDPWQPSAGFLEGTCGIGLSLLALLSDVDPAWDQALMLDVPMQPQ